MKRRTFIAGLGSAAAWPVVVRAQQGDRVRRIGVLTTLRENDPVTKPRVSAFTQALADLGWTDGRNVRMDLQGIGADINRRALARREDTGRLCTTPTDRRGVTSTRERPRTRRGRRRG